MIKPHLFNGFRSPFVFEAIRLWASVARRDIVGQIEQRMGNNNISLKGLFMKYREYRILKKLYELNPTMNDKQQYDFHFISNLITEKENKDIVLVTLASYPDYVHLIKNNDGYIHSAAITSNGVCAVKDYIKDCIWSGLRNIIIPAIVSIICSLVVSKFT